MQCCGALRARRKSFATCGRPGRRGRTWQQPHRTAASASRRAATCPRSPSACARCGLRGARPCQQRMLNRHDLAARPRCPSARMWFARLRHAERVCASGSCTMGSLAAWRVQLADAVPFFLCPCFFPLLCSLLMKGRVSVVPRHACAHIYFEPISSVCSSDCASAPQAQPHMKAARVECVGIACLSCLKRCMVTALLTCSSTGERSNTSWRSCGQVGTAAPVIAALASGGDREATVSVLYGGSGSAGAAADAVYAAIGNVRPRFRAQPLPGCHARPARAGFCSLPDPAACSRNQPHVCC